MVVQELHHHYHRRWEVGVVEAVEAVEAEAGLKDRPRVGLAITMEALVSLGEEEV